MAIHRETIEGRPVVITVEEIFERDGDTPLGFVARVSSPYENDTDGFLPYQGEFVKDERQHAVAFRTEEEARAAAVAYATELLGRRGPVA